MDKKTTCIFQDVIKNYEIAVYQMPSGRYMGHIGLKRACRAAGDTSSFRQKSFDNIKDAFQFIGWPINILPIPVTNESADGDTKAE